MIITYAKTGGEVREFDFDPDDLMGSELADIEKASGIPGDALDLQLQAASANALRPVLWVLLRRENKHLRLNQVDYSKRELSVQITRADRDRLRAFVKRQRTMPAEDKAEILAQLDAEDAAEAENELGQEQGPKAKTKSSAGSS